MTDGLDDHARPSPPTVRVVRVPTVGVTIEAELRLPANAAGVVVITPGVGQARRLPHVRSTSDRLTRAGWATVILDVLTPAEQSLDEVTVQRRLDIGMLAGRITGALEWLAGDADLAHRPVGLMGAGRGAAAALLVAARRPSSVGAIVSRGLRIELGDGTLAQVTAPTLLIAGEGNKTVREVARQTADRLVARHELRIVEDADGRFLQAGPLEEVVGLSHEWFVEHLAEAA